MKILLLNFYESPENFHFEQAFIRSVNKRGAALHVVHNFKSDYSFLKTAEVMRGWRKRYCEIRVPELQGCDLVISIDAPWRSDAGAVFYAAALKNANCKKTLIFNHLLPEKGHSPFYDLLKKRRFFKIFDKIYFLEFEDPDNFPALRPGARALRPYCVDTVYYAPAAAARRSGARPVIFTAGSKGRDFDVLFEAVKDLDAELNIITNSKVRVPAWLSGRVNVLGLNGNLEKIRSEIRRSDLVVVPVDNGTANPTAGMAVAFMAMSARKPALIRSTSWIRKYIRHRRNGYLYTDLSPGPLKASVAGILADRKNMRITGANARKTVLQSASLDRLAARILSAK